MIYGGKYLITLNSFRLIKFFIFIDEEKKKKAIDFEKKREFRVHPFSTYAIFSEKLPFLTP